MHRGSLNYTDGVCAHVCVCVCVFNSVYVLSGTLSV